MQAGLGERSPTGEREGRGLATAGLAAAGLEAAQEFPASWFAAYTYSHHEKRVASHFTEREIESFFPLYPALRRWRNGCEMKLDLPLFPNYVFVRMDPADRVRVLEVPGVLSLVGFGRRLAPLPDFEIETLRSSVGQRRVEPHPYLVVGERVRIKAGAMIGLEGVLVRKKNNFRVVLGLEAILQSVAVEVDAEDVEVVTGQGARGVSVPGFAAEAQRAQLLRPR
jgi:transcription antitermination factor NusG